MKYFIVAGEASGDLHGANLIKSIKQKDNSAQFNFWGGDKMDNLKTLRLYTIYLQKFGLGKKIGPRNLKNM